MTIEMQNHHAAVMTGSQIAVTAVRDIDVILPAKIAVLLVAEAGAVSLPDVGKQKFDRRIPDSTAFGGALPAAVPGVKQTVDAVMRTHGPPAAGTGGGSGQIVASLHLRAAKQPVVRITPARQTDN